MATILWPTSIRPNYQGKFATLLVSKLLKAIAATTTRSIKSRPAQINKKTKVSFIIRSSTTAPSLWSISRSRMAKQSKTNAHLAIKDCRSKCINKSTRLSCFSQSQARTAAVMKVWLTSNSIVAWSWSALVGSHMRIMAQPHSVATAGTAQTRSPCM